MSPACRTAAAPPVSVGSSARVDSAGWPACEECGKRLSRCKGKLHTRDPGRICSSCYIARHRPSAAAPAAPTAAPAAPNRSHKRARSDPGEPPAPAQRARTQPTTLTHRVAAPKPATMVAEKQQRITRQEERIMRLLDETHARRMAAEAAAAAAAHQ